MNRAAFILFLLLLCAVGARAEFGTLAWPVGVSNAGPYTLVSVVSNSTVFVPNGDPPAENDLATHQYNHHTRISWDRGTAWIAFSSANTNEQDGGMQCAASFSTNRGSTWSAPIQIIPSQSAWTNVPNLEDSMISYPRNFTFYNGTNYLVCAVDDLPTSNGHVVGAALLARAVYRDGTIGSLFRISTNDYTPRDGKSTTAYDSILGPPLMADSKIYGVWGGSYVGLPQKEWIGWYRLGEVGTIYVEPNTFSIDGGTNNFCRLWRSGGYVVSQSTTSDGGATWSEPENTTIPNCPSETAAIRLTDGRIAILGNPVTEQGGEYRDPLFLALTSAGSSTITNVYAVRQGVSDTPTYSGWSKTGGASYVSAVQVGNYIYVAYSLQKESIGFSRVLIPGLADNGNDQWAYSQASATGAYVGTLKMSQ